MSPFDSDVYNERKSRLSERLSNTLSHTPIEIDLEQPSRADLEIIEAATHFKGNKLIAEIKTPKHSVGVFHMIHPKVGPVVMLIDGQDPDRSMDLFPGDSFDLSDAGGEGKCIITLSESDHVFVHADDIDPAYHISTSQIEHEAYQVADYGDSHDDPEV